MAFEHGRAVQGLIGRVSFNLSMLISQDHFPRWGCTSAEGAGQLGETC